MLCNTPYNHPLITCMSDKLLPKWVKGQEAGSCGTIYKCPGWSACFLSPLDHSLTDPCEAPSCPPNKSICWSTPPCVLDTIYQSIRKKMGHSMLRVIVLMQSLSKMYIWLKGKGFFLVDQRQSHALVSVLPPSYKHSQMESIHFTLTLWCSNLMNTTINQQVRDIRSSIAEGVNTKMNVHG